MNPDTFDLSDIPPEQLTAFIGSAVALSASFQYTSCVLLVPDGSGLEITRFTADKLHLQVFSVEPQHDLTGSWAVILTWEEQ